MDSYVFCMLVCFLSCDQRGPSLDVMEFFLAGNEVRARAQCAFFFWLAASREYGWKREREIPVPTDTEYRNSRPNIVFSGKNGFGKKSGKIRRIRCRNRLEWFPDRISGSRICSGKFPREIPVFPMKQQSLAQEAKFGPGSKGWPRKRGGKELTSGPSFHAWPVGPGIHAWRHGAARFGLLFIFLFHFLFSLHKYSNELTVCYCLHMDYAWLLLLHRAHCFKWLHISMFPFCVTASRS